MLALKPQDRPTSGLCPPRLHPRRRCPFRHEWKRSGDHPTLSTYRKPAPAAAAGITHPGRAVWQRARIRRLPGACGRPPGCRSPSSSGHRAAWCLEPATTGAYAPACAGRGRGQSTGGLPTGSRLLRSAQPQAIGAGRASYSLTNGSRFLGPCPHRRKLTCERSGGHSGFDP
jgi:hypothetical protein